MLSRLTSQFISMESANNIAVALKHRKIDKLELVMYANGLGSETLAALSGTLKTLKNLKSFVFNIARYFNKE